MTKGEKAPFSRPNNAYATSSNVMSLHSKRATSVCLIGTCSPTSEHSTRG